MGSTTEETEACGIPAVDEVKLLEECDGCKSIRYCGDDNCKEDHREQHDEECKKRETKLHDKNLFRQPDRSHRGECPICFLPMPLAPTKFGFWPCCSKIICDGCVYANYKSNGNLNCPFCREPVADEEEGNKRMRKRVKANDPTALLHCGSRRYQEGDYDTAFEYLRKAAKLGNLDAHYQLGYMYWDGEGVEKDEGKGVYHSEQAAIGGHPWARFNLGALEEKNGNMERAVKHFTIAANLGYEDSMKALWKHYSAGNITKEELEVTLRTHKAAIDATKSPEREEAKNWKLGDRYCAATIGFY